MILLPLDNIKLLFKDIVFIYGNVNYLIMILIVFQYTY